MTSTSSSSWMYSMQSSKLKVNGVSRTTALGEKYGLVNAINKALLLQMYKVTWFILYLIKRTKITDKYHHIVRILSLFDYWTQGHLILGATCLETNHYAYSTNPWSVIMTSALWIWSTCTHVPNSRCSLFSSLSIYTQQLLKYGSNCFFDKIISFTGTWKIYSLKEWKF